MVLRIPCASSSLTDALSQTHEAFYEALANPTPFALLWQELKWGPAELLELNQVILNLEQTIAIDGEFIFPIIKDIARGCRFLHAADPKVIHGDLKAANVLVDGRFRAKIADFEIGRAHV